MKSCKRCLKEFDESETIEDNPARDLGDIFVSETEEIGNYCPECREEIGMMNLMGFRASR